MDIVLTLKNYGRFDESEVGPQNLMVGIKKVRVLIPGKFAALCGLVCRPAIAKDNRPISITMIS